MKWEEQPWYMKIWWGIQFAALAVGLVTLPWVAIPLILFILWKPSGVGTNRPD